MNSLQDLNSFSQTSLDLTDDRGSKVIFQRVAPLQPLDITNTISATTVSIAPSGNEIVDIINYSTANTRFRVSIITSGSPALTGSTITFGTLPSSLTLTSSSGVYTISGIKTISDWNIVKYFVWNLPANYASCPLWYLDVAVLYYDSARDEEMVVDWEVYDPRFYYIAKITSQFTQSTIIGNKKQFAASINSVSTFDCPGSRVYRGQANISALTSLTANVLDLDLASANIVSAVSVSAKINYQAKFAASISSVSSLTADVSLAKGITNITAARSYITNTDNLIFATNTPYIEDFDNGTYTVTLASSQGTFGNTSTSSSSLEYIGTKTEINSWFSTVRFYSNKDYTGSVTLNYTQVKSSGPTITKTATFNYASTASVPTNTYTFSTAGLTNWSPTRSQQLYALMDYLVVAGGGGGGMGWASSPYGPGGGGAGGELIAATNQAIASSSMNVNVGSGGTKASSGGTAGAGGNSYIDSIIAYGGTGGKGPIQSGGNWTSAAYDGGSNVDYAGGDGYINPGDLSGFRVGAGGGAGAGGIGESGSTDGTNFIGGGGGIGVSNSISGSSVTYAGGGGGGYINTSSTVTTYLGQAATTTAGSGGNGGSRNQSGTMIRDSENGKTGLIIIKTHA